MNDISALSTIEPWLAIGAMTVLGLLVGSFLNVVIHRLPLMMDRAWRAECRSLLDPGSADGEPEPEFNLVRPRSRCPACKTQIAGYDNIPVLSYVVLGGKCRQCRAPIPARYPLVETVSGLAAGYAAWHFGVADGALTLQSLMRVGAAAVISWYLVALALIDFDTHLLPDSLTQPLLWLGLLAGFHGLFAPDLGSAVLGAVFGYLSLWSVYWVFKLLTGKEGMGYGDFKLLAALGAWFGWQSLPVLILLSSAVGAVIGIGLLMTGIVKRAEPIPFGPYLAIAGLAALYWREPLAALFGPGRVL